MFQPYSEKEAERQFIREFAEKTGVKVIRLQEDEDDGRADGTIEYNGKQIDVEARRKGYPNHKGKTCHFDKGWNTRFLLEDNGIFLNESTIKYYSNRKSNFIYIVDIKGYRPKACYIKSDRIEKLLEQPYRPQKSTNSGVIQSVKLVLLEWFKEY